MSKFIERLKQVSQPAPPPMGFGAGRNAETRPRIQLVAHLSSATSSLASQLAMVDAVVLSAAKHGNGEVLWGLWLKKGDTEEVDQAIKSDADFVVLPAGGVVLPPDKKIGKVLQIESGTTDVLLRTVNELPVDSILLVEDRDNAKSLTWQRLMLIQRFASFVNKPLLVSVPDNAAAMELQLIWETGVSGVVVDVSEESDVTALKDLRQVIDSLTFPAKKKREKMTAVLPHISEPIEKEEEEEPDDDDDE